MSKLIHHLLLRRRDLLRSSTNTTKQSHLHMFQCWKEKAADEAVIQCEALSTCLNVSGFDLHATYCWQSLPDVAYVYSVFTSLFGGVGSDPTAATMFQYSVIFVATG